MRLPKSPAFIRSLRQSKWANYERLIRTSRVYVTLIICVTLFAVFGDDVRLLAAPKSFDAGFNATFYACFAVFVIDIFSSVLFEPRYAGSVVFFLDIIATASMLLQPMFTNSSGSKKLAIARLARVVRLMRVMRVSRFAVASSDVAMQRAAKTKKKLMETEISCRDIQVPEHLTARSSRTSRQTKSTSVASLDTSKRRKSFLGTRQFQDDDTNSKHKMNPYASASLARQLTDNVLFVDEPAATPTTAATSQRSMIGTTLINRTTDKIILLVLVLTLGVILLDVTVPDRTVESGLKLLDNLYPTLAQRGCFEQQQQQQDVQFREFCVVTPCCEDWDVVVRRYVEDFRLAAADPRLRKLTVGGTVFVDGAIDQLRNEETLTFSINESRVVADVAALTKLTAGWLLGQTVWITLILFVFPFLFGKDVLRLVITPLEIIFEQVKTIAANPFSPLTIGDMKQNRSFELDMIKEALNRLAKLLQVGLGQAGSDIIAHNLQSGSFSALQSGTKVEAVFGFCDIRNFTDCTEELQEECVAFVNSIAGLITTELIKSNGTINKNIGDAFLMVWKYIQTIEDFERVVKRHTLRKNTTLNEAADNALLACVAMVHTVAHDRTLQETFGDNLRPRMGQDFKVKIGLGLHVGWAIEGAVGSELKIDATYLSPHVNLSMRLEGETKAYKVDMLMSEWFVNNLSVHNQLRCRRVDTVPVPFAEASSMTMYTYVSGDDAKARAFVVESNRYYENYLNGKWTECAEDIRAFLGVHPMDGPAQAILDYISAFKCVAPRDWVGVRQPVPEQTATEGSRRRSSMMIGVETISEEDEMCRETCLDLHDDLEMCQLGDYPRSPTDGMQIVTPRSSRNDQRKEWSWE